MENTHMLFMQSGTYVCVTSQTLQKENPQIFTTPSRPIPLLHQLTSSAILEHNLHVHVHFTYKGEDPLDFGFSHNDCISPTIPSSMIIHYSILLSQNKV